MKLAGFFMLVAGWFIVLASMPLLVSMKLLAIFVLAGLGVEIVGLALVVRSHLILEDEAG
jgi:hypothetical protein